MTENKKRAIENMLYKKGFSYTQGIFRKNYQIVRKLSGIETIMYEYELSIDKDEFIVLVHLNPRYTITSYDILNEMTTNLHYLREEIDTIRLG